MLSSLRVSGHPAATWAEAAGPWLRANGANWRERRAVLAPNASWIAALKANAVAAGLPILGVEWLTPGRLRTRALAALPGPLRRVPLREDLHLLLELAAAQLPANPLARAYGPDPAPFQELLDMLEGAGWDAGVLPDAAARELASVAAQLRADAGWLTTASADKILCAAAAQGALPSLGEKLLAIGFGPGDWALRLLLEAATAAYADCGFVFDVVDYEQTAAAAWVGIWEEKSGATAEWLEAGEAPAPFAPLAAEVQARPCAGAASPKIALTEKITPYLWLADNLQAEADLVAAQALAFLGAAGNKPARVGIVVGSVASPLAQEVAARLAALELPHHDAPGHLPGRGRAQALFEAWLDWQEDGSLAGWTAWLRAAGPGGLLSEAAAGKIEKALRDAARATLSNDPAVLAAWLRGIGKENNDVEDFFAAWPRLPESAPREIFSHAIGDVSQKLHWPEDPEMLRGRMEGWRGALAGPLPRAAVLRWVRAVSRVPGRTRDARGREPWAPLQIVDAASAAAQEWTHLILGGLLHGEWPGDAQDSPLLDEARIRELNRKILRQGAQGEGHWTVAPGHAPLPTQGDRRRLDRANFARLLGLPTHGLALTARLADPADGRPARLSEYFWAVAKLAVGRLPEKADWDALIHASRARREMGQKYFVTTADSILPNTGKKSGLPDARATASAFAARRDGNAAFDEFSFGLKTPPAAPLRISCKQWQEAVARPGASWFKYLLRAEPRWEPAEDDPTRMSLGSWAHAMVRLGVEHRGKNVAAESLPRPAEKLWQALAWENAEAIRAGAVAAYAAAGRPLPEAWADTWARAARIAGQWIGAMAENGAWPQALAEIPLPENLSWALPGGVTPLALSGRIDLALFDRPVVFAPGKLAGVSAWVLDFKTGQDKPLALKKLAAGEGLQIALYARALLGLGAASVALTLLTPEADAVSQINGSELTDAQLDGLWHLLAHMAAGRWGDLGGAGDARGNSGDYPSATLPIPPEILRRKWEITHQLQS